MPNVAQVLKEEIQRIAKKEAKALTTQIHRDKVALKKTVSELRRRIDKLERQNQRLLKATGEMNKPGAKVKDREVARNWVTSKGIKSLRKKLRLSQAEFAELAGVSAQTVYQWERKEGKLNLRNQTKKALIDIRKIGGAREAKKLLEQSAQAGGSQQEPAQAS